MLKYEDIIKRMSDSEKIQILCDIRSLSDKNYRSKGIPEIRAVSVSVLGEGELPSPEALANSWDLSLVREVADALSEKAAEKNTDLLFVPSPRAGISPYRKSVSEDPFLASSIAEAYLKSAEQSQISSCVEGFGLSEDELSYIDTEPNERFLRDFLIKPYTETLSKTKCAALTVGRRVCGEKYGEINEALSKMVQNGSDFGGAAPVCSYVSAEDSAACLLEGKLFFEGSAFALESALSRYKKLNQAIKQGMDSGQMLSEEIAAGRAISPEMLDSAVDRLLSFVFSVKRRHTLSRASADAELALRAVRESLVLLKNRGALLPLGIKKKIALIGDAAFTQNGEGVSCISETESVLQSLGYTVTGTARGYEWNKTRNEEMIAPAVNLAEEADAVVLFLGIGEMRAKRAGITKKISLPANQLALLDSLGAYKEKIIAVLPSDEPWDICIPENCTSMITMPLKTAYSAQVLAETLSGAWNPCGKLAETVYFRTEQLETRHRTHRERDGMKTGIFLGYRGYDTAGEKIGFPFGHGLSYTRFVYTDLTVSGDTVSVTVKNKGRVFGDEIVQIYAAKKDSAVLRPKKELIGFARISLAPGKKGTVRIPLRLPEVYSREKEAYVTESGKYDIFAGASVCDIRLVREIVAKGDVLTADGGKISDYIHTKSNIITDNYKLEAKVGTMKRSAFNVIAGFTAIIMAIVLKLYCTSMGEETEFFMWFEAILCVLGLWLFIAEAIRRSAMRKQEEAFLAQANERLFENAEEVLQYNAAEMFAQEFDRAETSLPDEAIVRAAEVGDNEYFASIDKEQDFATAALEFGAFAKERGFQFRGDDIKKLFASFASSRLIVFAGMSHGQFKKLVGLLSEYFETGSYLDRVDDSYVNGESVLFRTGAGGNRSRTGVFMATEASVASPDKIHLAGLSEVRCHSVSSYFSAYMSYIQHPLSNTSVRIVNDMNVESFRYISQNLWFLMNLAEGESPDMLPADIASSAVLSTITFEGCAESEDRTQVKRFSYYQMEYLKERMNAYAPDESLWKKIDRLEEVAEHTASYRIDNKHWLGMENFAYAYIACGGGEQEAVDEAVAARLIAPMMIARSAVNADAHDFETVVETVFGEDHGEACRKIVRVCVNAQH